MEEDHAMDIRKQSRQAMAKAAEARIEEDRELPIDQRLEETFALCEFVSELAEHTDHATGKAELPPCKEALSGEGPSISDYVLKGRD